MRRGAAQETNQVFPNTLGPMKKLAVQGVALKTGLQASGFKVIEVYPGSAQDILRIPRKQLGPKLLKEGLESFGPTGLVENLGDHELDAATCEYVEELYLEGKAGLYGTEDHAIIMPRG